LENVDADKAKCTTFVLEVIMVVRLEMLAQQQPDCPSPFTVDRKLGVPDKAT
jgi:hypothetical protein